MQTLNPKIVRWVNWLLTILAAAFVAYKLYTFPDYNSLYALLRVRTQTILSLLAILLLLPLNVFFELRKWQTLMQTVLPRSTRQALSDVVCGWRAGLLTPGRLGDIPARCLLLPDGYRKQGALQATYNALLQTLTILFCGLPALVTLIPRWRRWGIACIWNTLRYITFCTQFYLSLCVVGISLPLTTALWQIPLYYILVTFTPSISFGEAAVRSSWAVVLFGIQGATAPQLTVAATLLWLINCVMPCFIPCGSERTIASTPDTLPEERPL